MPQTGALAVSSHAAVRRPVDQNGGAGPAAPPEAQFLGEKQSPRWPHVLPLV